MIIDTLAGIKIKTRRITRMPSVDQITDINLEDYINTYLLYNLPATLKLPTLEKTLKGTTKPNDENVYIGGVAFGSLLNTYTNVEQPIYVAGTTMDFYANKALFYSAFPKPQTIVNNIHTGNAILVTFTGTLANIPVLKNEITFSGTKSDTTSLTSQDDGAGSFGGDATGTINYLSGAYSITFSSAPAAGSNIYAQYVPYIAQKPCSILYDENNLVLRPMPDKVYDIEFIVSKSPTQLVAAGDSPELKEWGLVIALGAAKMIMEDRGDMDGLERIAPVYEEQLKLISRRATRQDVKKRNWTIYSGSPCSSRYWEV